MSLGTVARPRAAARRRRLRPLEGQVVVASAGNSQLGEPGPGRRPELPGAYPGVIAVAATRPDDSIAPSRPTATSWTSRRRATPVALDLGLAPRPPQRRRRRSPTHGIGYKVLSGTSMASPIVAGLAALMKTVRPDLTADEVRAAARAERGGPGRGRQGPGVRRRAHRRVPPRSRRPRPTSGPRRRRARPQDGPLLLVCEVGPRTSPPASRPSRRGARRQAGLQGPHRPGAAQDAHRDPAVRGARRLEADRPASPPTTRAASASPDPAEDGRQLAVRVAFGGSPSARAGGQRAGQAAGGPPALTGMATGARAAGRRSQAGGLRCSGDRALELEVGPDRVVGVAAGLLGDRPGDRERERRATQVTRRVRVPGMGPSKVLSVRRR